MAKLKEIRKLKAFTFIELSVTIIVIAIVGFIILRGSNSLISSSSVARARALTTSSPVTKIDGLVAWYETTLPESFPASQAIDGTQITEWRSIAPGSVVGKKDALSSSIAEDVVEMARKNVLTKTAGSDVTYVKNGINGVPAIKFSSTGKIALSAFSKGNTQQSSIFVVLSLNSYSIAYQIIFDTGPSSSLEYSLSFHNSGLEIYAGSVGYIAKAISTSTPYIVTSYFNANSSKIFVNDAIGNSTSSGTNILSGITIGGYHNSSYPSVTGLISEVIIYDHPLNIDERKVVMSYLAKKYKVSVTGL